MLNLVHLQALRAVLVTGSFSGAAKELDYTTSAVSQQIAALEHALRVKLFERGPSRLWPTAAGLEMGAQATRILEAVEEAHDVMRGFAGGASGRLRIGAFATVGTRLLPEALASLVARFPEAELTVEQEGSPAEIAEEVRAGRIDLGLVFEYELVPETWPAELAVHPVLEEELVVLCSERLDEELEERAQLADFSGEVWVANRSDSPGHDNLLRCCAEAGFRPELRFRSNDYDVIRGLVREDLGVALVPALAMGTDPSVHLCRLRAPTPRRRVHAVHRAADDNPLLAKAVEAVHEATQRIAEWTAERFGSDAEHGFVLTPTTTQEPS